MPELSDFPAEEYGVRRSKLARLMAERGLSAVFVNSEPNHRYLTGHWTGRWLNRSRPIFSVVGADGAVTIVCSRIEKGMAELTASECEIVTFGGSAYDLGPPVEVLAEVIRAAAGSDGRVGIEAGHFQSFTLPLTDFERLKKLTPGVAYEDASAPLWRLRRVKSDREIAYLRRAAEITMDGFAHVFSKPLEGRTEKEVQREFCGFVLGAGADRVGFISVTSDMRGPYRGAYSEKPFRRGELGNIDAGCLVHGYWSDFCRNCSPGYDDPALDDAVEIMGHFVDVCLAEIKAGRRIGDVFRGIGEKMRARTGGRVPSNASGFAGRIGHSIGLEQPEPPSLCAEEDTPFEEGMVFCVEPNFVHPEGRTFFAEEMVVVRTDGCELLSDRTSPQVRILG